MLPTEPCVDRLTVLADGSAPVRNQALPATVEDRSLERSSLDAAGRVHDEQRCPICDGATERRFCMDGYWIRGCRTCRHCSAESNLDLDSVAAIYGDEYFFGGGAGYPDYLAERELLIEHGRRYARLLGRYMRAGRVLDVGAAAGFILRGLAEYGWTVHGVEPNARLATYGQQQFGFPFTIGMLEELEPTAEFDLVTMIQVVGHFRHPRRAFERAAAITRPGGYWLIETWNHRSLTARLFGRAWHEWSPPSVLQWFSVESLIHLAGQFGLSAVDRGRARKRINGEHAKSLLRSKLAAIALGRYFAGLVDVVVPDDITIPYLADDAFWLLLRKHR